MKVKLAGMNFIKEEFVKRPNSLRNGPLSGGKIMSDLTKRICLNKSVLDFMESALPPDSFVMEFGGGWSSKWFADRCGRLIVIETSFKWAKTIKRELVGGGLVVVPRVKLHYVEDLNRMLAGVTKVDLVLIDCVDKLRGAATKFAWPLIKKGGWLLFDDAQRIQHRRTIQWLNGVGKIGCRLTWEPGDIESAKERVTLVWQKKH